MCCDGPLSEKSTIKAWLIDCGTAKPPAYLRHGTAWLRERPQRQQASMAAAAALRLRALRACVSLSLALSLCMAVWVGVEGGERVHQSMVAVGGASHHHTITPSHQQSSNRAGQHASRMGSQHTVLHPTRGPPASSRTRTYAGAKLPQRDRTAALRHRPCADTATLHIIAYQQARAPVHADARARRCQNATALQH